MLYKFKTPMGDGSVEFDPNVFEHHESIFSHPTKTIPDPLLVLSKDLEKLLGKMYEWESVGVFKNEQDLWLEVYLSDGYYGNPYFLLYPVQ